MAPLRVFELLLAHGATAEQVCRSRITKTVAEREIEPIRNLVHEVVHVAFRAAIVVAGEVDAALVIEKHPAREVNGLYPSQVAARIQDRRDTVDQPERRGHRRPAEPSRLERAERV